MKGNLKKFDAVIIGGGPGGYSAAIRIAQLGGKACIVEKKWLGGVCANSGCIPTKTLISIAKSISDFKKAKRFGLSIEKISCDFSQVKKWVRAVIKRSVLGMQGALNSNNIKIIRGFACIDEPEKIVVYDSEKKLKINQKLEAKNIIIATGSKPIKPTDIPDDKNITTTEDIFALDNIPQNLVIVGGGYIGVEFACIFNALGVKVRLIEKLPRILDTEEHEISEELERLMKRAGIDILKNTDFSTIKSKSDKILLAIGRQPNFNHKELKNLGISFDKGGIKTDLSMRTNLQDVYAVGDVNGRLLLAHIAIAEGVVAAENIMGKEQEMDYNNLPNCVFTIPEIASIGKREGKSGKFPFIANGKACAMGETDGFIKVYVKSKKLVGASIIGIQASSLIAIVQALIGKNVEEIKRIVIAHPTLPEAIFKAINNAGRVKNNTIN